MGVWGIGVRLDGMGVPVYGMETGRVDSGLVRGLGTCPFGPNF